MILYDSLINVFDKTISTRGPLVLELLTVLQGTVTTQQEQLGLFCVYMFLSQSKDMQVCLISDSKLPVGVVIFHRTRWCLQMSVFF